MFASQKIHYTNKHDDLIKRLNEIAEKFVAANDNDNTAKLKELIDKFQREEIIIAFCGHFSSGKSSIINKLIGAEILPTSPIPTKSNIIKLTCGTPKAKVLLKDNTVKEFSFEKDIEQLKKYCLDMQNVESMEIYHNCNNKNIQALSLLDTPGVDSLEEAKLIAYDTSLYLSDAIIYVMDYNHVQSEVNFNFTKLFKDLGKPVYLVINQIDKHCDFEIDFDFFKDSVITAFESWNIKPEGVFFTSLFDDSHPENQLAQLHTKIAEFCADKDSLVVKTTVDAAIALIKAHINKYQEDMSLEKEKYLAILENVDLEETKLKLTHVNTQISELERQVSNFESEVRREAYALLDGSRLTPYSTTEAARSYLESRKEGFKTGFFFAAKKTAKEQSNRLMALHKDFAEKVTANLDWHLKDLLRKIPDKYKFTNEEYLNMLYSLNIVVTPELLEQTVNMASVGTREYVINYCKDISTIVKTSYRKEVNQLIDYLMSIAENKISANLLELNNKKQTYENIIEAATKLSSLDAQTNNYYDTLQNILLGRIA